MLQEFAQQVEETARGVMGEIHTALPGTIMKYDAGAGTATVKPVGEYVTSGGQRLEYPVISGAPLVFPVCQSIGAGIAFPVEKGDSCLIIVSEVELDEWRSGAKSEGSLRFDLTSAVVIPGLLDGGSELLKDAESKKAVVVGNGDNRVIVSKTMIRLDTGGARLDVDDSGVKVQGNLTVTGSLTHG